MENEELLLAFVGYIMLGYLDTTCHVAIFDLFIVHHSHQSKAYTSSNACVPSTNGINASNNDSTSPRSACIRYKARCFIRPLTVLNPAYTLPGGDPSISDTIASRATLIFWKEPIICIFLKRTHETLQSQCHITKRTCQRERF